VGDVGWFAGFFDGEGSICIPVCKGGVRRGEQRTPYVFLQVCVYSTIELAARMYQERWGGRVRILGGIRRPNPLTENPQPLWTWVLRTEHAREFLVDVGPRLVLKREQAALGLRFLDRRVTAERPGPRRPRSAAEVAEFEGLAAEMRALNARGKGRVRAGT
jgi:hypothetical protein